MTLTRRKDSNYFNKVHISDTFFSVAPTTSWNFASQAIALMVQSNDINDVIQYSFDGTTVHGDMVPTFPSEAIVFDNRIQSKIWFRRESSGDPVIIRVEAWRHDS